MLAGAFETGRQHLGLDDVDLRGPDREEPAGPAQEKGDQIVEV